MTIDVLFPILYAFFFAAVMSYLFSRIESKSEWVKFVYMIPLLAAFSDFLENIFIVVMLFNYPKEVSLAAVFGVFFTRFKWMLFDACIVGIILEIFWLMCVKIKRRKNE
ncbi:MAG: hypothetical protein ABIH09_01730 [Candidatus Omnitrophota bacterium]